MRNRGVEIFIIGNEGVGDYKLSENLSSLDISAMMSVKGLDSSYHNLFMKIHDKLSSFVQGININCNYYGEIENPIFVSEQTLTIINLPKNTNMMFCYFIITLIFVYIFKPFLMNINDIL